jgi:hypothetical protein
MLANRPRRWLTTERAALRSAFSRARCTKTAASPAARPLRRAARLPCLLKLFRFKVQLRTSQHDTEIDAMKGAPMLQIRDEVGCDV